MIRHPYIAFLRRPSRAASAAIERALAGLAVAPHLSILHDSATITVFAAPDSPHLPLRDGHGIILGHLFERATGQAVEHCSSHALDAPAADFVRSYWGGYVALRSRHGTAEIVRDPSGAVPCYQVEIDDWHVVSSSPSLLVDLGLVAVEIDWTIIAQALVYRDLRPARTALRGIAEIQPGLWARVYPPGLETQCVWSPWTFTAQSEEIHDSEEAVATVSQAVRTCLQAWGGRFDTPLAEISGGLDSSIVAAELARLGRPLSAITFKAVAGDPDETPYAAAVADHIGATLTTLLPEAGKVELAVSAAAELARPNARSFAQALDGPEQAVAQALGADAFFSGGGGDNVFCYLRSVAPVIDRLRRQGVGAWLLQTANDMAMLTETSPWEVWYRTIRRLLRRSMPPAWAADTSLLAAGATQALPLPAGHPWMPVPADVLPGKRAQVLALMRVQNHLDAHARQAVAPIVFPLLSQPVMEACLRVPSWLWCAGGRNRAVARTAFADALPEPVVARQSKGAFDNLCTQILSQQRDTMREMLTRGALAREGLLDVEAVSALLAVPVPDGLSVIRLLMLADVEAWARCWLDRAQAPPPSP